MDTHKATPAECMHVVGIRAA